MKRFRNRTRLKAHGSGMALDRLDLHRFPLAEDFELVLRPFDGPPGQRRFNAADRPGVWGGWFHRRNPASDVDTNRLCNQLSW